MPASRIRQWTETSDGLGFVNHGGTLDDSGLLFVNRCTWTHAVSAIADALGRPPGDVLRVEELSAIRNGAVRVHVLRVNVK
jgi:hypothetical protein